jgi:hypothetical protein
MRVDDEELVLHARSRLVVYDPVDEAELSLEGWSLDCGRPAIEGRRVEGFWEQVTDVGSLLVSSPVERSSTVD